MKLRLEAKPMEPLHHQKIFNIAAIACYFLSACATWLVTRDAPELSLNGVGWIYVLPFVCSQIVSNPGTLATILQCGSFLCPWPAVMTWLYGLYRLDRWFFNLSRATSLWLLILPLALYMVGMGFSMAAFLYAMRRDPRKIVASQGLAVTSLVCSCFSVVFSPAALVGVAVGHVVWRRSRIAGEGRSADLAKGGLFVGYIMLVVVCLCIVAVVLQRLVPNSR